MVSNCKHSPDELLRMEILAVFMEWADCRLGAVSWAGLGPV